jgi:tetratricopeptide (TPR) repeat protein
MKWEAKHKYLAYLILGVVSVLVYSNSLQNGFVYDDNYLIVENGYIRDWHNLFSNFSLYRPLRWATYTIDYRLWESNPFGYHLTNVLLHISCTLLLYLLASKLFRSRSTPLIIGLLFAVHPIHTEVVNGISNRNDLLATLFLLSSLTLYIKKNRSIWFYIFSFVSFVFGVLSKEVVGITIPLILAGYDLYFTRKAKILQVIRRNIKYYIPYGLMLVFGVMFGSSLFHVSERVTSTSRVMGASTDLAVTSYTAIFSNASKAASENLRLLFSPFNLCADYPFPRSSSIFEVSVLLSLLVCVVFVVFMVKSYKYWREASFGLFWIFVTLIPVSNIIPVTPHFVAERYLYAPSIGFCMVLAVMINKIYCQQTRIFPQGFQKKFAISLILVVLVLYSILTFQRNFDWKSDYTLWSKTVRQKPNSGVTHLNLGVAYAQKGQTNKAEEELKKVLKFNPRSALVHYNLGNIYTDKGIYYDAIEEYKKAIQINPEFASAHCNLGAAYVCKGLLDEAIKQLKEAIELNPGDWKAHFNLIIIYSRKGLHDEAKEEYQKAIEINPEIAKSPERFQIASWLKNLQKR